MKNSLPPIDYSSRRKKMLKAMGPGSVALFFAPHPPLRNGDVSYKFRQSSDFYYLSGFDEPHSLMVLAPSSPTPFMLFVEPRNKLKELWEGAIIGPKKAQTLYGADWAGSFLDKPAMESRLVHTLSLAHTIYYRLGLNEHQDRYVLELLEKAKKKLGRSGKHFPAIVDPLSILGEMRKVKDKAEIHRLKEAARISAMGHCAAMEKARPGLSEREMEAVLLETFFSQGSSRQGYQSIVASGANACVLHYISNCAPLKKNELLLIDAGTECDYLTADITRTFPISGTFTPAQAEIYNLVLKAQKVGIALASPQVSMQEIHEKVTDTLIEGLIELKIIQGPLKKAKQLGHFKEFYPHGTGHFLGLDVHDVGKYLEGENYDKPVKLKPGNVITIEPGLYFSSPQSPKRYKHIGVRIEDDVLITAKGCEVLTHQVPKEIQEVEAQCQKTTAS